MQSISCFFKYISKILISAVLHFFWFLPVQKNKVLFMNDHSYTFSDNLKYLALELVNNNNECFSYKIYFSLKSSEVVPQGIIPVKYLSLAHFYHALTSSVLITNNSGISYLPIRRNRQLVINTWHGGGPYKVTGLENINNQWYMKDLKYNAKKTNFILSSCEVFSKVEAPGLLYVEKQVLNSGMPRMDAFFDEENRLVVRKKVLEYYQLSDESRIVLYAPTFRGQFENYEGVISDDVLEIDYKAVIAALNERFGDGFVFALRLHPRLRDVQISDTSIINMSRYEDAEELLIAADILITDYSSVMWDFSFSRKPVFLFATDINDYEVNRGFYISPVNWPYPIATTNDEMIKNIQMFDPERYCRLLNKHYTDVGSYEKGTACQIVTGVIEKHIKSI